MTVLADFEIKRLSEEERMLSPFVAESVGVDDRGERQPSYGLSSYGYDVRLAGEFVSYPRDWTWEPLVPGQPIPDHLTTRVEVDRTYVIEPGEFVLACTMETFRVPRDVTGLVKDKSTYARLGLAVQNTVLEPGWEGQLTLELSNHGPRAIALAVGWGIAQVMFMRGAEPLVTYDRRAGKYMGQSGVTLPR